MEVVSYILNCLGEWNYLKILKLWN
jgi:hypothetical protein